MREKDFKELEQLGLEWHEFFMEEYKDDVKPKCKDCENCGYCDCDGIGKSISHATRGGEYVYVRWFHIPCSGFKTIEFGSPYNDGVQILLHNKVSSFTFTTKFFKKHKEVINTYRKFLDECKEKKADI